MTVALVWLSYRSPQIIARGTWDTDQLTLITERAWGTPTDPLTYSHHIGFDQLPPDADGAVVILGAQHHIEPELVERLNRDLARLRWVVLVLAGDECSLFPWADVRHPNMRLWIMTPRPHLHKAAKDAGAFFIGEGYHVSVPGLLAEIRRSSSVPDRASDFYFAGQITHARREQMVAALRRCYGTTGTYVGTAGFLQGSPLLVYLRCMADARVIPCPSGPCTPDSFRFYEALEAGCVPLADAFTPEGWPGYWQFVYGDDLPFPVVEDWRDLPGIMRGVLDDWEAIAARCGEWWEGVKRTMVQRLDDDVRAVRGG